MTDHTVNEVGSGIQVLVDFPAAPGRQQVATRPEDLAAKSAAALDRSMDAIREMAQRVTGAVESLGTVRPQEAEVTFAIRFDTQAGAVLAKVGMEANLQVTLTWKPTAD